MGDEDGSVVDMKVFETVKFLVENGLSQVLSVQVEGGVDLETTVGDEFLPEVGDEEVFNVHDEVGSKNASLGGGEGEGSVEGVLVLLGGDIAVFEHAVKHLNLALFGKFRMGTKR